MPRVDIPVTTLAAAGSTPPAQTDSDATNDHEVDAYVSLADPVWLEVFNNNAASKNVTILTQLDDIDGLSVPDRVVAVPAGATRLIPLGRNAHAVRSGADVGKVYVDPELSTDLKFRAYRIAH